MHARVVTNQLQPGKKDEWIAICRDSIVPTLRQQQGFQGFVMLADTNSDKCIARILAEQSIFTIRPGVHFHQSGFGVRQPILGHTSN